MINQTMSIKEWKRIVFRHVIWGSLTSWVALFLYAAMWKVAYDLAKVGQVKTNLPLLALLTTIFIGLVAYLYLKYKRLMKKSSPFATATIDVRNTEMTITSESSEPIIVDVSQLSSITQDHNWLLCQFTNDLIVPIHLREKESLPSNWTVKLSGSFWKWVVSLFVVFTLIGGYYVSTVATNLNGALAWKINHMKTDKKIKLLDDHIYTAKLTGILESVRAEMELEPLLMTNNLNITFDEEGTITKIETYLYAYDEKETLKSGYLLYYEAAKSKKLTVHKQDWRGQGTTDYDPNNDLSIVASMLDAIPIDEVAKWNEEEYAILYKGLRTWDSDMIEVRMINENGEIQLPFEIGLDARITGPSISLYVPGKEDTIVPIRYIYRSTTGPVANNILPTNPTQYQPIQVNDQWSYAIADQELYVSPDLGKKWMDTPVTTTELFTGEYNGSEEELIPGSYQFTENQLAVLTGSGLLYQSRDKGETWENSKVPTNLPIIRFRKVGFSSETVGYVLLTGDRTMSSEVTEVFLTNDGGKSWTKTTSPDTYSLLYEGGFVDGQTGFLSYGVLNPTEPMLYVTQDAGQTWTLASIQRPAEYQDVFVSAETPVKEGEQLTLLISQGPNGDFEGGKVKGKFISLDNGLNWEFVTVVDTDAN